MKISTRRGTSTSLFFSWWLFARFLASAQLRLRIPMRHRLAPPAGRSNLATTPARVAVVSSASAGDGRPKGFGTGRSAKQPQPQHEGQQISPPPTPQQQPSATASSQPWPPPQRADSPAAATAVVSSLRASKAEQNR